MPTLGQPDASIYSDIQLPKPLNIGGDQPAGRVAGPNAAMSKLAIDQQKDQQIQSLAQQYGDDYDGLVKAVTTMDPERGLKMQSALAEARTNEAKNRLAQTESSLKSMTWVEDGVKLAIQDPTQYPKLLQSLAKQPGGSQFLQYAPDPNDPDLKAKLQNLLPVFVDTKDFQKVSQQSYRDYLNGDLELSAVRKLAAADTPDKRQLVDSELKGAGLSDYSKQYPDAASASQAFTALLAQKQQEKPGTEKGGQAKEGIYQGKRTFGVFDPNTNTFNVDGKQVSAQEFRPIPPQAAGGGGAASPSPTATIDTLARGSGYTPDGLRKAAKAYHESGVLPGLGMGGGKAKQAIQNAEAMLYGAEGDLAMSGASFKANQGALNALTKQLGAVQAYEGTGLANLKMFTDLAEKIPDTGVPWLNTPVRALSANMVGSENMAAINAARQVALTEISKVVNNPNLSGALSDSARKEVLDLVPDNATFGQIKRVAQVLQRDMSNRPLYMKQQIDRIKYEMAHPGETAPGPNTAPAGRPQQKPIPGVPGGIAELRNGRWIRVQ